LIDRREFGTTDERMTLVRFCFAGPPPAERKQHHIQAWSSAIRALFAPYLGQIRGIRYIRKIRVRNRSNRHRRISLELIESWMSRIAADEENDGTRLQFARHFT